MVRLTIEKPDQEPEVVTFETAAEMTIGRGDGCVCCLDFDPMVSRMHAVILVDPPSVRVKDLNSTNGLTINGEVFGALGSQKIIQPLELRDGDEMLIGSTRFLINLVEPEMELGPELEKLRAEQAAAIRPESENIHERPIAGFSVEMIGRDHDTLRREVTDDTVANMASVCPDIPGYKPSRFLATGRTGTVYKANSLESGRKVALKVMAPGGAFTKKMLEAFRSEMHQARRLRHPCLARLLDAGDAGPSTLYTVSEYINGENLASYLDRCPNGRIPLHAAYSLMLQLAGAMCYAHQQGMVHRDIHPGGIMLFDENGRLRAKFTDIGLSAFWAESGLDSRSAINHDTGRLGYVAPEELSLTGDSKPNADVFGLSAVFYRILSGRVPYDFGSSSDCMRLVEEGKTVPIDSVLPELPETLVVVLDRGLSADPDDRYRTACDLLEALENVSV